MITFIDIKNTDKTQSAEYAYTYDGRAPYVHWFDDAQSIGLNYVRSICFASDAKNVVVDLSSDVFNLLDISKLNSKNSTLLAPETIDYNTYYDLSKLTHDASGNKITTLTSTGVKYNNVYVHIIYILARGLYVGEIRDTFTIDGVECIIGADFYDENESLGINLANFGQQMSNEVQRAVYEMDIHEQKPDYILLNRKYKEMLNEIISIIANKGSYKSLINSLNWFEYGDIVKMHEYWRHQSHDRQMLFKNDITQLVSRDIYDMMSHFAKTSYISLNAAMERIATDSDGFVKYVDMHYPTSSNPIVGECNPQLQNIIMMWTRTEMSLKMTLLGNFFATYFMPVHLDLIHSTVEDIVYTNTFKTDVYDMFERVDLCDDLLQFDCMIDSYYNLSNVRAYTYKDTLFAYRDIDDMNDDVYSEHIIGVDTDKRDVEYGDEKYFNTKFFDGIGVIIPFKCTLHGVYDDTITSARITLFKNGSLYDSYTDYNVKHKKDATETGTDLAVDFNILITEEGDWRFTIEFTRDDNARYIKSMTTHIDGITHESVDAYRIIAKSSVDRASISIDQWLDETDSGVVSDWTMVPYYVFSARESQTSYDADKTPVYRQFISASNDLSNTSVHTNHVIVFKIKSGVSNASFKSHIKYINGSTNNISLGGLSYSNAASVLSSYFSNRGMNYSFITLDKYHNIISNHASTSIVEFENEDKSTGDPSIRYIIAVNRMFDNESCKMTDFTDCVGVEIFERDCFIPCFYDVKRLDDIRYEGMIEYFSDKYGREVKVDEISESDKFKYECRDESYTIRRDDVLCFIPSLSHTRDISGYMWEYRNSSTGDVMTPEYVNLNDEMPAVLQPLFGRYDVCKLPDPGYYDITLKYCYEKGGSNEMETIVSSQFRIER